jgi:hypothetical protein
MINTRSHRNTRQILVGFAFRAARGLGLAGIRL